MDSIRSIFIEFLTTQFGSIKVVTVERVNEWIHFDLPFAHILTAMFICVTLVRFVLNKLTFGMWSLLEWSLLSLVYITVVLILFLI